jgi:hypothetical protein
LWRRPRPKLGCGAKERRKKTGVGRGTDLFKEDCVLKGMTLEGV